MAAITPKITPCLCFNDQAEAAVNFYLSVFEQGRILLTTHYGEQEMAALARLPEDIRPGPAGTVKAIFFELFGQQFLAINGGGHFKFNYGVSLMVNCENQEELDRLWDKLCEGGKALECGWLQDRFGMPWQLIPANLAELMGDDEKSQRVSLAVYDMVKLDIATLQKASEGGN